MPRPAANDPGRAVRGTRRQRPGPLHNQHITPQSLKRYQLHCHWFLTWCTQSGLAAMDTEAELDLLLQDYIEFIWDVNMGLSCAQTTLAGVQHLLRHTVKLRGAWRLIGVWRRAEPPSRAPPMPVILVHAMVMQSMIWGDPSFAASLLLGFYAYLRTGELLALHRSQCFYDAAGNLVVALGQSKSGKRRGEDEFAVIDASPVTCILRLFLDPLRPTDPLVGRDHFQWRRDFDRLLDELGVLHLGYRPYSLRRGGATHAYMSGLRLAKVMFRGRWTSEKTARIYIQEAAALLHNMAFTASVRQRLHTLAAEWHFP